MAARVASLLPGATEIACALGARGRLVARSHECDFPPDVRELPALTSPRLDPAAPSGAIDRDVRALVEAGLSIYEVDAERLRSLAPDVVLTQTLCEVCAVTPADLEAALAGWTGGAPAIVSLAPERLDDVFADVERVGAALGLGARGFALAAELRARVERLAERARGLGGRPRAVCVEWLDPLMIAGHWMPELVARAGGEDALARPGDRSTRVPFETIAEADPDFLLVTPCGFSLERAARDAAALAALPGFAALRCAREGRVVALDANRYFSRPGPRLVEGLEILIEALHPGEVDLGRRAGWRALERPASAPAGSL